MLMFGTERCGLCGELKPLCKSHFLPKSLYKLLRPRDRANPNPSAFTMVPAKRPRGVITSRQSVERLLCTACENLLSAKGENYVIVQCLRQDGTFPLRDSILATEPLVSTGREQVHHISKNPAFNTEALRHFAIGVFWKASVRAWHAPTGVMLQNPLGPIYEESFRQYLIGRACFPVNARLMIFLCGEPAPPVNMIFPDTRRCHGYHAHRFFIPGLCFHLLVGKVLPPDASQIWGPNALEVPVDVHTSQQDCVLRNDIFGEFPTETRKLVRGLKGRLRYVKQ